VFLLVFLNVFLNQIQKNEVLSTQKNANKAMADLEAEINKRRQN